MHSDLNVFQIAKSAAQYAGQRQAVIAENIANADTPGFRARDLVDFESAFKQTSPSGSPAMRSTRAGHLSGTPIASVETVGGAGLKSELSGNTVSLEEEMFKAAEVSRQHSRAVTIYNSALRILRTSLGRS